MLHDWETGTFPAAVWSCRCYTSGREGSSVSSRRSVQLHRRTEDRITCRVCGAVRPCSWWRLHDDWQNTDHPRCLKIERSQRCAVIGCKLKQNANEGCNSCSSLAGVVLSFIACFICDRSFIAKVLASCKTTASITVSLNYIEIVSDVGYCLNVISLTVYYIVIVLYYII